MSAAANIYQNHLHKSIAVVILWYRNNSASQLRKIFIRWVTMVHCTRSQRRIGQVLNLLISPLLKAMNWNTITSTVWDTWSVQHQTYSYLLSKDVNRIQKFWDPKSACGLGNIYSRTHFRILARFALTVIWQVHSIAHESLPVLSSLAPPMWMGHCVRMRQVGGEAVEITLAW